MIHRQQSNMKANKIRKRKFVRYLVCLNLERSFLDQPSEVNSIFMYIKRAIGWVNSIYQMHSAYVSDKLEEQRFHFISSTFASILQH